MNFCLIAYDFNALLYVMRIVSQRDIAFHYIADDALDRFKFKIISIGPAVGQCSKMAWKRAKVI